MKTLRTPPPLPENTLRIVPLGGLGEVGRNMTVFEVDGKLLIVDCGVLFPEDSQPGVDLILPDYSYIEKRMDDVVGIVLTHGHEDHIGAVPYLLRLRADIPIIGSELTLAFVAPKLAEHRVTPPTRTVVEGERLTLGPFDCEFVAVNHSIPDALAVMLRTRAATALITGDFKMDQLPLDGRITDLRAFARLGEEGVDIFLVDSTNAEVPGFTTPEREIGPVLDSVFAGARGQIVVASFASHVHRVQQVFDAAAKHGRKVALIGRSMERNMAIAAERGYLEIPAGVLSDLRTVNELPVERRVYVATGSQGEPMAALSRIANASHPKVAVGAGDTVIFASSLIPGNENSVYRVINGLTRLGAKVVHQANARVHVSGHASAGELLYCYNIVQPKNVMPVHGEIRHLVANGALAVQTGISAERVMLAEDGVVVDVRDGKAQIVGAVPCGHIYVDGSSVGEISEAELVDRRILSEEGFITVFAAVDTARGVVLAGPQIQARGMAEDDAVFTEILPELERVLAQAVDRSNGDTREIQQALRQSLGRWVSRQLKRRPMIVPVVVDA
ncbi:ribonuclease J [Buchananella hordeovulneris]|uniref:Ribonuclease J n=1 Tax=Buchananella hordeovulneris TaxID=52770 RepID=A0A1Q5PVU7_9ACTO|nr:ribonuclease J [Buchananella hordeovulneris]MDO5080923.1 ribonuclease J [Buchananella hordeovulneris]OKL51569.1 RNase J family beta-CASP ribonuclease [Buchananella hordeovulneris]RRD44183.1 ribonuclease J [Buchananella hordeovulneris]